MGLFRLHKPYHYIPRMLFESLEHMFEHLHNFMQKIMY